MIIWLTCTHGRYRCLQRNLRCYLDQDFKGESVMFICNTGAPLKLGDVQLPSNKHIYLDNALFMNFTSVGEKFNHALKLAMALYPNATIVTHADDDDIFLPNHLTEGNIGMNKALLEGKMAYKPFYSYYRERKENQIITVLSNNTLEPSIFVDAKYLQAKGYRHVSIKYHQQWLDPLIDDDMIDIDEKGVSTLIYNWGDNGGENSWNIYKMSGSGDDGYRNYMAHREHSNDMGNFILLPFETNVDYYKI